MSLDELLARTRQRWRADADRYSSLDQDECMLCDARGPDKRSLRIDCFYAIEEAVEEVINLADVPDASGYYLRICKSCRARLLGALRAWASECRSYRGLPKDSDGAFTISDPDATVPIREDGATVMITEAEWHLRAMNRA